MKKFLLFFSWVFLSITLSFAQNNCVSYTLSQNDIGVSSAAFGVALADFNGDGWLDVVKIDAYRDIEMFFNDGTGHIDTTTHSLGQDRWRYDVKAVDIDNDGDMDFITCPFSSNSDYGIEIWRNDGQGNFTLINDNLSTYTSGYRLAVGDLNGDGYVDIFFPYDDIDIWLNNGNGTFSSNGQEDFNVSSAKDVTLGDFDGDGDLDAAVVRDGGEGFVGKVFFNDGTGQFTDSGQELTRGNAEAVDCADIDADGDIDIVAAEWHGHVIIYRNDGLGNFYTGEEDTLFDVEDFFNDIVLKDINYDGYPDIITDVCIWLNDADNPGHFILQDFSPSVSTHGIAVGDINNDSLCDIYIGRFSSNNGDNVYLANTPDISDEYITLCYGDSLQIAGVWHSEPGTYFENDGCNALKRIHLQFYPPINTTIVENNGILTVAEPEATYQWLDCNNNFAPIEGATGQSFQPTESGSYAVVVYKNSCSDTSACYEYTAPAGVETNPLVDVYPNPTEGLLHVSLPENENSFVQITDISGKMIAKAETKGKATFDLSRQKAGIYFLQIENSNGVVVKKIIKR